MFYGGVVVVGLFLKAPLLPPHPLISRPDSLMLPLGCTSRGGLSVMSEAPKEVAEVHNVLPLLPQTALADLLWSFGSQSASSRQGWSCSSAVGQYGWSASTNQFSIDKCVLWKSDIHRRKIESDTSSYGVTDLTESIINTPGILIIKVTKYALIDIRYSVVFQVEMFTIIICQSDIGLVLVEL